MASNIEKAFLLSLLIIFIIYLVFNVDFIRNFIIPPPTSSSVTVNSNSLSSGLLS